MSTEKKYGNWALIAVAMLLFGTAIATIQFKVPVVMGDIMTNMNMDAGSASWLMSVSMTPGAMQLTRMFFGGSSTASALVSDSTPPLDAA